MTEIESFMQLLTLVHLLLQGRFLHVPPAQPAADWDSSFALPWWQDAAKYRVGALSSSTRNIRIKNVLTDSESTLQVGQAAPLVNSSSSSCSRVCSCAAATEAPLPAVVKDYAEVARIPCTAARCQPIRPATAHTCQTLQPSPVQRRVVSGRLISLSPAGPPRGDCGGHQGALPGHQQPCQQLQLDGVATNFA